MSAVVCALFLDIPNPVRADPAEPAFSEAD
jgi:hypothetical protein